jgi:uncharacterized cofD-like protein
MSAGAVVKIAVLGGGNGISVVLEGLARRARSQPRLDITAIVATADDGGSSGRIRSQRGGLPPGDLRRCLVALSPFADESMATVFTHRYDGDGELGGHALGNLILTALAEQHGSYDEAVRIAAQMLGACGQVRPVSLCNVRLEGVTLGGDTLRGESEIGKAPAAMHEVRLSPPDVEPAPGVLGAIEHADLVVVGPGSLFTSLMPVLLVPGVADAVRRCRGERVMVANLMTQPGETVGMSLEQHLDAVERHAGASLVRHVLINDQTLESERLQPYVQQGSEPVTWDSGDDRSEILVAAPIATIAGKIRHDPDRLVPALLAVLEHADRTPSRSGDTITDANTAREEIGRP